MPRVYVPMVPEFEALAIHSRGRPGITVSETPLGYYVVVSDQDMVFRRRELKFKPAVWYSCFAGGVDGRIVDFGRDEVTITSA